MKFTSLYVALTLAGYAYAQNSKPDCGLQARQNNGQKNNQQFGNNGNNGQQNNGQQNNNQGQQNNGQNGQGQNNNGQNNGQNGQNNGQNNNGQNNNNGANLTLDPSLVQDAAFNDGLIATSNAATVGSLPSNNNFLDFCKGQTITNGKQVAGCNPSPMGNILENFPSHKFQSPKNGDTIPANTDFNISLAVKNIDLGHFTEPTTTYYLAPAQINAQNILIGHTHVVMQPIDSLDSTALRDTTQFNFFKGVNDAGENGVVTVLVPGGVPPGTYTIGSLGSAANHQPPLPKTAQRGMGDDMIYITAVDQGQGNNGGQNNNQGQNNGGQNNGQQGNGQQGNGQQGNGQQGGNKGGNGRRRFGNRGGRRQRNSRWFHNH